MHFVAGLDDFAEMRVGPVPLRGRGHRGGRRLRARRRQTRRRPCCTSVRAWPMGGPTCTTPGGPARRCSTSWATTRPTTRVYDAPLQSDIASIASALEGWQCRSETPDAVAGDVAARARRGVGPTGSGRDAGPPLGRLVGRGRRRPVVVADRRRAPPPRRPAESDARARARASAHASLRAPRGRRGDERRALATRPARRERHGLSRHLRDVPGHRRSWRGDREPRAPLLPQRVRDQPARRPRGPHPHRCPSSPWAFFAYPNVASRLVASGCEVLHLAPPGTDTMSRAARAHRRSRRRDDGDASSRRGAGGAHGAAQPAQPRRRDRRDAARGRRRRR